MEESRHPGSQQLRPLRGGNRCATALDSLQICFLGEDDDHYAARVRRLMGDIPQDELIARGWELR